MAVAKLDLLKVYDTFSSWKDYEECVQHYIQETHQPMVKASSKLVVTHNKILKEPYPEDMVYFYKTFRCSHRGSFRPKGQGIRYTKSLKQGCPAKIQASLDKKEKRKIVVTTLDERHNHELGAVNIVRNRRVRAQHKVKKTDPQSASSNGLEEYDFDEKKSFLHNTGIGEPKNQASVTNSVQMSSGEEYQQVIGPNNTNTANASAPILQAVQGNPKPKMPFATTNNVLLEGNEDLRLTVSPSRVKSLVINHNRHLLFLRSLLPSLTHLTEAETLDFHTGVLKLLKDIRASKPSPSSADSILALSTSKRHRPCEHCGSISFPNLKRKIGLGHKPNDGVATDTHTKMMKTLS